MKQRNKSEELATKKDLLLLKGELENKLVELKEEILVEVDEKARNYRDQILTKLDGVMGELGVMRDENTIGSGQTSQLREEVEDHEKRIKNLEKLQQAV